MPISGTELLDETQDDEARRIQHLGEDSAFLEPRFSGAQSASALLKAVMELAKEFVEYVFRSAAAWRSPGPRRWR